MAELPRRDWFEDFLKEVHAKQYTGLDDDMPDDYERWLEVLDKDELIELGNQAVDEMYHDH